MRHTAIVPPRFPSRRSTPVNTGDLRLPHRVDADFLADATMGECMREALHKAKKTQTYVAKQLGFSKTKMSLALDDQASLRPHELIEFMRATDSIAPAQWIGYHVDEWMQERAEQIQQAHIAHQRNQQRRLGWQ